ncbi:hypothetical protein TPHA_0D02980 [Tetrapisispora phaffii CBS 4417]|uniref:Telomere length regulation protein conserved domain-containing protein n=1 Tax=Tetrapisispora phaffii (strain ATCC 24235 / CBS 4417 / NBRC 1672 / NRRL Y-8282 / UCD 70-5) TaxID=1071381 RepID=G8BSW3_TETPH|nr:hypothetical protein TPHA_0D02980 [Tetrapisispora phaffii CBS 4417]CCE62934.1 hypothetical protein TPHA_0D02980 [Tetrapisispora phaffii CBS 4417]
MDRNLVNNLGKGANYEKLEAVLTGVLDEKIGLNLEVVMIIITVVCPVYPSLQSSLKSKLLQIISNSYLLFSNMINYSSRLKDSSKNLERQIYLDILIDLLRYHPTLLYNYMQLLKSSKEDLDILKSVFFGSRLFNLLSSSLSIVDYIEILTIHFKCFLDETSFDEINLYQKTGEMLTSFFSLNPLFTMDIILDKLLLSEDQYWIHFKNIITHSKRNVRRNIIINTLFPYFDIRVIEKNYIEIFEILSQLQVHQSIDYQMLTNLKSTILIEIILKIIPEVMVTNFTDKALRRFSDVNVYDDEKTCQILCMLLSYRTTSEQRVKIAESTAFLNGVTKRLTNNELTIRERTMFIAKMVTNGTLEYESSFDIIIPRHDFKNLQVAKTIKLENLKLETNRLVDQDTEGKLDAISKFNDLNLDTDSDDDEDSYTKKKIVFMKDLLLEFENIDKSKRNDFVSLLKTTVKLVRQKRNFISEVSYYAAKLIVNICTLNNNFEEKDFEAWRINALETILFVTPESIKDILKLLFTTELSLQQRMSILSSLGLSARELRGYDDEYIVKYETDFFEQKLPWSTNQSPISLQSAEQSTITEINPANNSIMENSQVTWKSKKLLKSNKTSRKNEFRKHASIFFYPLANQWLNGIDLGTYDKMFKLHYLKTLHIIHECAFPSNDYKDITALYEEVLADGLKQELPIEDLVISIKDRI